MRREMILFYHNRRQQEKLVTISGEELQGFLRFVYMFTEDTHVTNWEYRVDGEKQASGIFDKPVRGFTRDTFDLTVNENDMKGDNLVATLDSTKWYLNLRSHLV